jgi:Flp pilus assembly pilin Flp
VHPRDATGQATTEYTAILALVAAALVGAGAVVGLGEVGTAVAYTVRTGICIVGGDVCRASDAAAAGLAPCTVHERSDGGGATVSLAWLRLGESKGLTVAARSDGSVLVTKSRQRKAGAGAGIGIEASPLGIEFGLEGSIDATIADGSAWEFPDAAAAAAFLAGRTHPPPTWRFGDAGEVLSAEAGATLGGMTLAGVEGSASAAAGARVGRGTTTLYIRERLDSVVSGWPPGARFAGPSSGDAIVELTLGRDGPSEIAFRRLGRGAGAGRVIDTVARLDLRDPANRAAAAGLLKRPLPWPGSIGAELRPLLRLAVQRGTVEQSVYDVRDSSSSFDLAARLGAELGVDVDEVHLERRLVAASAWTAGSQERVREDCVM